MTDNQRDYAQADGIIAVILLAGIVVNLFAVTKARGEPRNSTSLNGVVAPLAAKVREIQSACGSKIVSSIRRGARIPGGRVSNHAIGRAVDLQGNPRCIYDRLKGWPGGVSTDYARAPGGPHVHVSYNPNMEWGLRFAHRGGSKRVRYAKQHRREALAQ